MCVVVLPRNVVVLKLLRFETNRSIFWGFDVMRLDFSDASRQSPLIACWKLFYPLAISMMLSSTIGVLDMYLASIVGPEGQAAVGIGDQMIFAVIVLGTGLSCAASSLVSRSVGAKQFSVCQTASFAALLLAAVIGILSTFAASGFAASFLKMFHCSPDVESLAIPYTVLCSFANAPFIVVLCQSAIFRSLSRTDLALYVQLLTVGSCHLLSWTLFFSDFDGGHSLTALSLAWVISSFIGASAGMLMVIRLFAPLKTTDDFLSKSQMLKVLAELCKLAIPAVMAELAVVAANFLLYGLSSGLTDAASAQAALTVKLKIEETIALIPIMALGMAASVVVGQNVGAGEARTAYLSALRIAGFGAALALVVGALVSMFAGVISNGFSNDLITQRGIFNYLILSILYFPACAFSTTIANAIEGAGSTVMPMWMTLLILVLFRGICAFVFAINFGLGIFGIAISLCLSQIIMACGSYFLLHFFFFRSGVIRSHCPTVCH